MTPPRDRGVGRPVTAPSGPPGAGREKKRKTKSQGPQHSKENLSPRRRQPGHRQMGTRALVAVPGPTRARESPAALARTLSKKSVRAPCRPPRPNQPVRRGPAPPRSAPLSSGPGDSTWECWSTRSGCHPTFPGPGARRQATRTPCLPTQPPASRSHKPAPAGRWQFRWCHPTPGTLSRSPPPHVTPW